MHVAESRNGWPLGPRLILTRAAPPELHDGAVGVTGPPRPVMRQQAGTSLIILVAWETRKRFD
jgi:hypothetical protein